MLHGVCFGEEAGARNVFFSGKVAAAGDERQPACAAGAGWARRSSQCKCGSMCFACLYALQLHGALEAVVANSIVMLH